MLSCVMMRVVALLCGCGRGAQAQMVDTLFKFLKKPSIKGMPKKSAGAPGSSAKLQLRPVGKVR